VEGGAKVQHVIPLNKALKIEWAGRATASAKQNVKEHLKNISTFHTIPNDRVIVHIIPRATFDAEGVRAKFDSDSKKFMVDQYGTSFGHEFGHYLDRFHLSDDGKPWSEKDAKYRKAFGFTKRPRKTDRYTQYFDPMRNVSGWYTTKQDGDTGRTTGEYARSMPKEHFASAYNKLLGERDGSHHSISDKDMKKYKRVILNKLKEAGIRPKRALLDADMNEITVDLDNINNNDLIYNWHRQAKLAKEGFEAKDTNAVMHAAMANTIMQEIEARQMDFELDEDLMEGVV
jgi:hypothetical protein